MYDNLNRFIVPGVAGPAHPFDLRTACLSTWLSAGVCPGSGRRMGLATAPTCCRGYVEGDDEGGRVVNTHVPVCAGVNIDGHREILGVDICSSEDGAGWLSFFRSLVTRGLSGVALVTT